jgi:hypothetical protein
MPDESIRVDGLDDLRRELRRLGDAWPKELKVANRDAADIVVTSAKGKAAAVGGVAAKAAESLRALNQQRAAVVALGGAAYPYAMGAEFGSIRYRQFRPWRGSAGDAGYFLYPAIRGERDRVLDTYEKALDRITKRAFPN